MEMLTAGGPSFAQYFPPELLALIFQLGTSIHSLPLHPEPRALAKPAGSPASTSTLPFQVVLTHVCRAWRAVALDMPFLWTRIEVSRIEPFDFSTTYLSRTKELPLDITINAYEMIRHVHYMQCEFFRTSNLIDEVVRQTNVALDYLLPHRSRWRSLTFVFSSSSQLDNLLERLAAVDDVQLLQKLRIICTVDKGFYDAILPARLDDALQRPLFAGNASNLSDVEVHSTSLRSELFVPRFGELPITNLTSLKLSNLKLFTYSSLEHFLAIIKVSPSLETLSLKFDDFSCATLTTAWWSASSPVLMDHTGTGNSLSSTIVLSKLKSLSLALRFRTATPYATLICYLRAPELRNLSLDLRLSPYDDDNEYDSGGVAELDDFVRALCAWKNSSDSNTCHPIKLLSQVEHLTLNGSDCAREDMRMLARSFTGLRTLAIDQRRCTTDVLSQFSSRPSGNGKEEDLPCSLLESMDITSPSPGAIAGLHPVARIHLTESSRFLDPDAFERNSHDPALLNFPENATRHTPLGDFVIDRHKHGKPLQHLTILQDAASAYSFSWAKGNVGVLEYRVL